MDRKFPSKIQLVDVLEIFAVRKMCSSKKMKNSVVDSELVYCLAKCELLGELEKFLAK